MVHLLEVWEFGREKRGNPRIRLSQNSDSEAGVGSWSLRRIRTCINSVRQGERFCIKYEHTQRERHTHTQGKGKEGKKKRNR